MIKFKKSHPYFKNHAKTPIHISRKLKLRPILDIRVLPSPLTHSHLLYPKIHFLVKAFQLYSYYTWNGKLIEVGLSSHSTMAWVFSAHYFRPSYLQHLLWRLGFHFLPPSIIFLLGRSFISGDWYLARDDRLSSSQQLHSLLCSWPKLRTSSFIEFSNWFFTSSQ